MKERNDIDWKLFELLENDLSPEEEAEILAKIEAEDGLADEWNLVQQTRLVPPDVTYKGKKGLLKKETVFLEFANLSWLKYAAVIAIVAISYPLWKSYIQDNASEMAGAVKSIENGEDDNSEVAEIGSGEVSTDKPTNETKEVTTPKTVARSNGYSAPGTEPGGSPNDKKEQVNDDENRDEYQWTPLVLQPKGYAQLVNESTRYSAGSVLNTTAYEINDLMYDGHDDYGSGYAMGLRPIIDGSISWMLSPFQNSKLRIHRVQDNRMLEIEYKSIQYHAVAMVNLKGFSGERKPQRH